MSAPLASARLVRLKQVPGRGKNATPGFVAEPQGSFEVQFNPTSLKISRSNNVDKGGATTRTQRRQTPSVQPATLTFDLEFDTAEGDRDGNPKDVRELTRIVRQFAEPSKEKPKEPPPAIRFEWGRFAFQGMLTQLTEDLDYFSPEGLPLRAKVSVTITEQNPDWEAGRVGAGARDARAATPPGGAGGGATRPSGIAGTGPGAGPTAAPSTTALAQAGESVQQVLSRLDADPAGWRAAMAGLSSPLGLAAGAQVQLGAEVSFSASASAGIGATAGFSAGAGAGATAGLEVALGAGASAGASAGFSAGASAGASAGFSAGASAEARAGFDLAASGGIAAGSNAVAAARVAADTGTARASFAVPAVASVTGSVTRSSTGSATGSSTGSSTASATGRARTRVDAPDPRSITYARGVPLGIRRRDGR